MIFFSGFGLKNELEIFSEYLPVDNYSVVGFSYGAQKALDYVSQSSERVETLTLISPAYFENTTEKYKRLQLLHFKKDSQSYIDNFIKNIVFPSQFNISKYIDTQIVYEDLETLLRYKWEIDKINIIKERGTKIVVYIGVEDKIIDYQSAISFFKEHSELVIINKTGHILRG